MAMPEKQPAGTVLATNHYYEPPSTSSDPPPSAVQRWSRRALAILLPICFLLAVTGHRPTYPWIRPSWWRHARHVHNCSPASPPSSLAQVPLEAHIMSKCPDARDCLRDLVVPAMAQIADKVDFTLSYIGTPVEGFGIECKHGPGECMGNLLELCAADVYPDPKLYLGFTMCLSNHYQQIPQEELVKDCALEHGMDFRALNECASRDNGAHAYQLLNASVARTIAAHVEKSCTVRLNNEIRCIRDGGEWKDCPGGHNVSDLIRDINNLASR